MLHQNHMVLFEVKCPHKFYGYTVESACSDKGFCCDYLDGNIKLKISHAYFFQVQGQMAIAGLDWCDFVIWLGPGKLACQSIEFMPTFRHQSMLPRLVKFYDIHATPFLETMSLLSGDVCIKLESLADMDGAEIAGKSLHHSPQPVRKAADAISDAAPVCRRVPTSSRLTCFVCRVEDARVLRKCHACHVFYHHCCQVKDKDGKLCDSCFLAVK